MPRAAVVIYLIKRHAVARSWKRYHLFLNNERQLRLATIFFRQRIELTFKLKKRNTFYLPRAGTVAVTVLIIIFEIPQSLALPTKFYSRWHFYSTTFRSWKKGRLRRNISRGLWEDLESSF